MDIQYTKWTKKEFQIYVLLLCANSDRDETSDELDFIKTKVDASVFDKIYKEFSDDDEDASLDKIDYNIQHLDYSNLELAALRRDIYEVFFSDCNFKMKERNLDRILDNILY